MSSSDTSTKTNLLLRSKPRLHHYPRKADCLGDYQRYVITSFYFYIPLEGDVRSNMIMANYYPFVLCCTDTDQIVNIILFSGPYHLCLPAVCCPLCSCKWTPGIGDLLGYRYWPATTSCQMLFKFDVFTSFEQMKLASPAISQQAFLKMLEHRSLCTGQVRTLISL